MSLPPEDMMKQASLYASRRGFALTHRLGFGRDGTIWATCVPSAVKVHHGRETYERELACYRHLCERQVLEVLGHHVPQLINSDDGLQVIEMTIVRPPFLLDFASAYLESPPDFSPEVWEAWEQEKSEQFESHWDDVLAILSYLRRHHGIHLLDVNPGNIMFEDTPG